jgi:uracil-DNA glycosylase
MRTIEQLIEAVHQEAVRAPFPVDTQAYERAGRDPSVPVLFAGSLAARVCVVGRDLGKDEVAAGQPLIGSAGRLVRAGLYQAAHGTPPPATDRKLESVLDYALLTNTVPFKPPGNKAYAAAVKERFRPFLAELLTVHWRGGDHVITLGNEAFQWFTPYADDDRAFEDFWARDDRYEAEISCTVAVTVNHRKVEKRLTLLPLPHPSPLNARWYKRFPDLLAHRLGTLRLERQD